MRSLILIALTSANIIVLAQTQKPDGGVIQGIVQSGNTPLPGVVITGTNTATNEKVTTSTDLNGQYQLKVSGPGTYSIECSMAAFAPAAKQADVKASVVARLDFELALASRSQAPSTAQPRQTMGARGRGAQRLQIQQTAPEAAENSEEELTVQAPADVQVPGFVTDAPTESVAVLGNTAETTFGNNVNFDRAQIQQLIDQRFGLAAGPESGRATTAGDGGIGARGGADGQAGPVPGGFNGRGGGPGVGGGGARGGGGGGGFALGRGGRGFGATAPRGNLSYTLSDSDLDAAPYSLTGQPLAKPEYTQNRFSASLGGPLVIPKVVRSTSTVYTVTYNGARSRNPYDVFSTVPTLAERSGDFSQSTIRNGIHAGNPVQIFDPVTHAAIPNNVISPLQLNPAAQGLLAFIPAPNLPGAVQNFHYVTSTRSNSDNVNVVFNHTFSNSQQPQGRGGRGGSGGRGGGGFGGRGGRGSNLNFRLQVSSQDNVVNNPFPTISGINSSSGVNATLGYVRSFGRLNNSLNLSYNRNRTTGNNLYAFQQDIEGSLGIVGVSTNPFDWGLPNLSFTNFSGLNDVRSSLRRDQTLQLSENMFWNRGRHNVRWGGDVRIQRTNTHTTQNSRGTFTFTGARTAAQADGAPIQGSGYDFADFLLGLPQSTSLQFGNLTYNFRGSSWGLYVQDDWRFLGNLTLNMGLRYDYASPYIERDNQIVNLDVSPGFTAVAPVLPEGTGAFNGAFPRSLVRPDRNNIAPRIGLAWRMNNRTVIRAGYGVTYNGAAYAAIALQMANQPPFSLAQTNINSPSLPLTLQNGFPVQVRTVTNNYGIDPNYKIGYAQQWNLNVQRDLRRLGVQVNMDYTGTKGTRLDIIQAPNRTATGLRIGDVQPFNWETSDANSILHSASLRINRRMTRGISLGGTYQFSKSIDNASSVSGGGGSGTVAQDAFNLRAERGLSNFDQTHRLNLNYNVELPFGTNKRFFAEPSILKAMFGDWQLNGSWNIASGTPATARVLGSYTDVARGSNGSLRADSTGLPPSITDPTVTQWFNTGAFTVPATGQFGNVGRNTIRGPATYIGNLSINKTFPFADGRSIDVRAQATNFLNMPQFRAIDTTVNSPSFGRVTSAGSMRKIQLVARFNF